MNKKIWVNKGGRAFGAKLSATLDCFAADRGGGRVVDCAWFALGGGWTDDPVSIYYVGDRASADCEFKNRYFGLAYRQMTDYITIFDADRIEEMRFGGLVVEATGEFVFSRWRHDFRSAQTASFAVDGGLDYFRAVGSFEGTRRAVFSVRDGQFVEIT